MIPPPYPSVLTPNWCAGVGARPAEFVLFPADKRPETTLSASAGDEFLTSLPTIISFELPKKVPMDWDISAMNSKLRSFPGIPLIPLVPKNFRVVVAKETY